MTDQVNIPLLRKAVEWAEAEAAKPPEMCEWEQRRYILPRLDEADPETASAYGGLENVAREREEFGKAEECGTCYCIAGYVAAVSGRPFDYYSAEYVASEELGISAFGADALFCATNSIADVRRIAEEIAGERL
jgi:hypothetical protein